jgi:ZIP family zinc transporter
MAQVIIYGLVGALGLFIGSICGVFLKIKEKIIGIFMAFGAGALIAAASFGLLEESYTLSGLYHTIWAFAFGGLLFILGDLLIVRLGGRGHKRYRESRGIVGRAIVFGAVLDGIPESLALGVALLLGKGLGLLLLIAIFISNFPEGISSAYDLLRAGQKRIRILVAWGLVALVGFACVILGYAAFGHISKTILGITEAVAAGALLAMVSSTMIPESFKESGFSASLVTVFSFSLIFFLSKFTS